MSPVVKARYKVYSSAIFDAPIEAVWREMRDMVNCVKIAFAGDLSEGRWVKGSAEQIPSVFEFTIQPGGPAIVEEVVGRSDIDYSIKYRTVGVALSIVDYIGTFDLRRITDEPGKTFMETTKDFSVVEGTDAEAFVTMYEAMVHQETRSMKAYFAKRQSA